MIRLELGSGSGCRTERSDIATLKPKNVIEDEDTTVACDPFPPLIGTPLNVLEGKVLGFNSPQPQNFDTESKEYAGAPLYVVIFFRHVEVSMLSPAIWLSSAYAAVIGN